MSYVVMINCFQYFFSFHVAYQLYLIFFFFFSSRRRHTRCGRDWSSDVCSSDLGVAEACLAINADKEKSFSLTGRANLVAVITDGSAVLGLGNIGPEASMPVMEGKCALFKRFADLDCVPLSLNTQDVNEIIKTIEYLAPNFGGINLEDIKAPNCFIIEEALKERLDIPVFHDDQHGTAIVVGAAVINALKIVKKSLKEIKIVINGAGAAGIAIAKFLLLMGNNNIIMVDKKGILTRTEKQDNPLKDQIAQLTNHQKLNGDLAKALRNADLFIGVSAGNLVNEEMVKLMNKDPIVFALANPIPEITPTLAKKRSEEHTSELQSRPHLVCRLLLE